MEINNPCQSLSYEYTDAINSLEDAKKHLEKIQSCNGSENTGSLAEKEALKRVARAKSLLNQKRKELEECQERNNSFYSEPIKEMEI